MNLKFKDNQVDHQLHGLELERIQTPTGIIQISIFEHTIPPHFRITGEDIDSCSVTTMREGGSSQMFSMENRGDYWQSKESIPEPHSFSMKVSLTQKGLSHEYAVQFTEHPHDHGHTHGEHGHSHGLVDPSIIRSKDGVKAVSMSLVVLLITAVIQVVVFFSTNSVSLLVDLIHNFGDALTALPLAAAFLLRNKIAERYAGYFVVLTIFVSACVAGVEAVNRLFYPQSVQHLYALIAAGSIGFVGNEIAAYIRTKAGKRLNSPALIADGAHARIDGLVSLSVVASGILVALSVQIADPIIGLIMTLVILHITWQSYKTIKNA